ncbi:type II secretion system protein N [Marinobacter sp.]|uniref:type II secretion system protein N n=1 Tax=Marinobacter sp. TaxID=50741 RepID=UPI0034A539CB
MTETAAKSFLRPGKICLLVLVGVLVYLVALVIWVPAGWLWHQASSYVVLPPQVQVQQVSGTVWSGAAGIQVAGFPVRASWDLGWPSLSALQWPVAISVASSQSSLNGDLTVGWPGNAYVDASGRVTVAEFEDLIRQSGGAMIEGEVLIDQLQVSWEDNQLTSASGSGRWDGGPVSWPMGNQTGQADFPPMEANLDTTDGGLSLDVREQGGEGPAADANILWDGMMELRVYKRMVDLADQPWSGSAQPSDVIFRVRQPLLPGGF